MLIKTCLFKNKLNYHISYFLKQYILLLMFSYGIFMQEAVSHKIIESYKGDDSIQLTENDAFEQVVGERSGYVKGMGFGPLPPKTRKRLCEEL